MRALRAIALFGLDLAAGMVPALVFVAAVCYTVWSHLYI